MMQSHPSTMTVAHVHDDTVTPVQDDAVAPFHDDTVAPVHDDAVAPVHDEHRIRKRRSNPQKWVENIKKSKGAGKAYIYSRGNEKRMEEPQPSDCRTCLYKCNIKFTEEDRGRICREYWQLEDYAHQKDFILSKVDRFDVQRQRSRGERKRTKTQIFVYSFKNGSEVVRVCKQFFLKTIDISLCSISGYTILPGPMLCHTQPQAAFNKNTRQHACNHESTYVAHHQAVTKTTAIFRCRP